MYSFKEKKTHFVALRNPDVAQYDLELLAKEVPGFPLLKVLPSLLNIITPMPSALTVTTLIPIASVILLNRSI